MKQIDVFTVDKAPEQIAVHHDPQDIGHAAVGPEVNLDDTQELPPVSPNSAE